MEYVEIETERAEQPIAVMPPTLGEISLIVTEITEDLEGAADALEILCHAAGARLSEGLEGRSRQEEAQRRVHTLEQTKDYLLLQMSGLRFTLASLHLQQAGVFIPPDALERQAE